MEREVGGGIGMGNTCTSMADSCQCITKTTIIIIKKKDKAKEKMLMKKHKIQTRNNYRNNGYLKMNEIVIKNRKWNEFSETHKIAKVV